MELRLYACPRCGKEVKSISGLKKHINSCKIPNSLPYCQSSNSKLVLDYNATNPLDLPSNKNKEDISLRVSNNGGEIIRPADMDNNKEDIRLADISKKRPTTPN